MTKPSNDEVATVLETAAGLYEDEKIEWCAGSWALGTSKVTACAEGALLLASGYSGAQILVGSSGLFDRSPVAKSAKRALLATINKEDPIGRRFVEVFQWNDQAVGGRKQEMRRVRSWGGDLVMMQVDGPPDPTLAKAEVVEMMKQAAKDLRNEPERKPYVH